MRRLSSPDGPTPGRQVSVQRTSTPIREAPVEAGEAAPSLRSVRDDASRSPRASRLATAAFFAPAAWILAASARDLAHPQGAAPGASVAVALSFLWLASALLASVRSFFRDLGAFLLQRVRFRILLPVAVVSLGMALSGPGGTEWPALLVFSGLLALAAGIEAARLDPARAKRFLLLAGVNAIALVAADFAVRWTVLPGRSHRLFLEHDPALGWKLRSGLRLERREARYASVETVNEMGFRTPLVPFEKPPGLRRVVLLGDSHTEGYTVSDEETYGRRLERHLAERFPVQVISLGVGGFSTDQELLSYLHVGRRFAPDAVVLQFCHNDVSFNVLDQYWRGPKPRFRRFGETLVLEGVPVPNTRTMGLLRNDFLQVSAIALLVESSLGNLGIRRSLEKSADREEAWRVTDLLVRDLRAVVEADGAKLVVFHSNPDAREEDEGIQSIARARSIPFLDI